MNKQLIERIAINTYTQHKSAFQTVTEKWLNLVSRYDNELRKGAISSQTTSKIALGGAFALVENAIPRLLSRQPKYRYLARGREDANAAEVYDEFSDYQWTEADCQSKIKKVARWGLTCGLAGWRMGWKIETNKYKKRTKEIMGIEVQNPLLQQYAKTVVKDAEDVISNYTFEAVKPSDLIWSVESEEVADCRVIGFKTRASIKLLKSQGFDVKQLTYSIRNTDEFKERMNQKEGISTQQENREAEETDVEVATLYIRVLNDTGYYEYYVCTLGTYDGNPSVLKTEENTLDRKFAPMGIFRPVDRLGKFYGVGIIEPVTGILDGEEDLFNMALEALYTDISRPMEYVPANLMKPDSIGYGPRKLIPVKVLGQTVAVMTTPSPNMNGVQYMNDYLTRTKQNVSAITDFQTGADQLKGSKTLGEIQIKTQESNARISMIMDNFEKQVLEPMGKYALWMNHQFLAENPKTIFRVVGKKGKLMEKNIKFKDIEAIKDVIVVAGSTMLASQQAELQKWTLLLNQVYMEEKSPNPTPINKEAIWERLLEDGVLIRDTENFLPSLKEREEGSVQNQMADMAHAKEENANPLIARVLPTDTPKIHIPLHQAEIKVREQELSAMQGQQQPQDQMGQEQMGQDMQGLDERKVQELQMLVQHLNDHTAIVGGPVPPHAGGLEVGQGTNEQPQ
jgi:hypothetical protein